MEFYQRLFAGNVQWALHTTYTCNVSYVALLLQEQFCQGQRKPTYSDMVQRRNTAVFYHKSEGVVLRSQGANKKIPLREIQKIMNPISADEQTHHAKISLIQYKKTGEDAVRYRLAVYSKNLEFSPNLETSLLFELQVGSRETVSGKQLVSYLDKLRNLTDKDGKEWLKEKLTDDVISSLGKISLISEFNHKQAELFFGGCGDTDSLGAHMQLHTATSESVVLTPPEFLKGTQGNTRAWTCFDNWRKNNDGPVLYDSKASQNPSHIKLYLLQKKQGQNLIHELWVGSANATARGIGWGPQKDTYASEKVSIECLVKFSLEPEAFVRLKKGICERYAAFPFTEKSEGSLKIPSDPFGPWVCNNFEVFQLKYDEENSSKKLTVTLKLKTKNATLPIPNPCKHIWRPAEYSKAAECDPQSICNGEWKLEYSFERFQASQGVLLFGTSCSALWIPDRLLKNIKTVESTLTQDDRLSQWLLSENRLNQVNPETDFYNTEDDRRALQYYQWLVEASRLPDELSADRLLQEQPMQFQKNAAARIVKILENNSRAFLADEAGLGKTYSVASAVCQMAQKKWEAEADNPTPFYCIYVAPNKALLHKCAADFVRKAAGLLRAGEEITALQNDICKKEAMKTAVIKWYNKNLQRKISITQFRNIRSRLGDDFPAEYSEIAFEQMESNEKEAMARKLSNAVKEHLLACLDKCSDQDLYGARAQGMIRNLGTKFGAFAPEKFDDIRTEYEYTVMEPDRLVNHYRLMQGKKFSGKKIVLLTVSTGCLLDRATSAEEKAYLQKNGCASRVEFTEKFLAECNPNVIIWDEFHRYTTKFKDNSIYNCIVNFEKNGYEDTQAALKSIFVSATPYRTNISGVENQDALDQLYTLSKTEREELTQLPSFQEFAKLFCEGYEHSDEYACRLNDIYAQFTKNPTDQKVGNELQKILRIRMVRHERTQLQGELEQHIRLYPPESLCKMQYAPVLRNTMMQSRLLEQAGFSKGDCKWALSVPWILSFFKKNKDDSVSQRMDSSNKRLADKPELFVYDDQAEPVSRRLQTLPWQNLPFYEMCRENLQDEMTQLLWVPPTVPLYQPGETSIFHRYRDYSKLLVFAEYHYYQKGGALLLSDYAKLKNQTGKAVPDAFPPELPTFTESDIPFDLLNEDFRALTLDSLIEKIKDQYNKDTVTALFWIASPAICASKLGFDVEETNRAFRAYFGRDGVRQALWKWICDHGYSEERRWVEGILRYCAEGNLYAVLEEWKFVAKENDAEQLCEILDSAESLAKVTVTSLNALAQQETSQQTMAHRRNCSFADRLTGDIGDVESGDNEEAITACANRFSSPFWPMVMFAGRGAQEGMDFHQYCLRIMHMTIPRGAVSFDQRNGRIDRFRSLLVRRRTAELLDGISYEGPSKELLKRMFAYLVQHPELKADSQDQLFPNWHIFDRNSRHHFQQLFPVWEFTDDYVALKICDAMLESYRRPFGTSANESRGVIDLRAPEAQNDQWRF